MTTPNTVRARRLLGAFAALVMVTTSCDEHLPSGPSTFATTIQIVVPHDTVVVGDSTAAQAQAVDAEGHTVQGLKFKWTSADPASLGVNAPTGDDGTAGRTQTLVGKKAGRINLTSAPGKGTTVTVVWPVPTERPAERRTKRQASPHA